MNILSGPDNGGSDSDTGDLNTITINHEYAKRYEHNKKREDLQRYEELKLKKLIQDEFQQQYDDSSGDDDEEDDVIKFDPKQEVQFVDALLRIRNNDPVLKDKEVKLFDDVATDDDVAEDDVEKKEKVKKKVYLKDVNANMLLENGADFADDVSDDDVEMEKKMKEKSFVEQMAASQKEFLDAVEGEGGDEDDGEIFKVKDSGKGEEEEDEDEIEYEKKLDEYFTNDDKLSENDKGFLRDFFVKKMWLEKDGNGSNGFDGFDIDVSDDDEIMARQEDYEREINFRHQEGGEDHVMVHPRKIPGLVRKVDSKRQRQRESKKEREEERKRETMEEIKRLKNVKKEEMNEKLKKFREIAGIGDGEDCVLDEGDLEGDFDPEEYDRKMKKAFDDKFYGAKDADPNFASDEDDDDDEDADMEKPNFDEEDELLGLPKGWDDKFGSGDGFTATREKVLKKKGKNDLYEEEEEEEEETEIKVGKKKRKRKSSKLEEEFIKKQLEEFYKLDCEDTIGDLKTRFKYKPVKENNYGLKAKDILVVDDKELNQLIPLKKLATYREDEFHVPYKKIKETKQRIRAQLKGESSKGPDNGGKRSKNDAGKRVKQVADDAETENPESETQNEGEKKQSRKQRRKLRLQELKLAPTRRMAYNLDVPKKKKKDKSEA